MSWFSRAKEAVQKFKSVAAPYLSPKRSRERLKVLAAFAVVHATEFSFNYFFTAQAEKENVDDNLTVSAITTFGNIAFSGAMYAFKIAMSNWLTHSITESLIEANALEGWLDNDASVGIDFIQTNQQGKAFALSADTPVERILTEHIKSFSEGTVKLTIENISRLVSSAASLYVIGRLSNANTALLYFALGGGLVTVCCNMELKRIDLSFKSTQNDDTINARLTHIRERSTQILALKGEAREVAEIREILLQKNNLAKQIARYEVRNNSILYVTFFGLSPLISTIAKYSGSILQGPPSTTVGAVLFQQHVFQLLINFFIAMENYTQKFPKFSASVGKVYSLQQLVRLWREARAENNLIQNYPGPGASSLGQLVLDHFSVSMPTREKEAGFRVLLEDASLVLNPAEYQLLGASNAGKSTTFKAIMGLWPYASGTVSYPCQRDRIRFIPQETFIPYDPTLLEMILYPKRELDATISEDDIIELLRELNLSHLIASLHTKQDLKKLSRGEQQRIAIIGAIIAEPTLLLMDEATASIDEQNKIKVEELIRCYLPGTLVITIDHSPLKPAVYTPSRRDYIESFSDAVAAADVTIEMTHPRPVVTRPRQAIYESNHTTFFKSKKHIVMSNFKLQYEEERDDSLIADIA